MQIVIDMCKDDFDEICMQARMVEDTGSLFGRIRKSIFHGTPLPKGHGRLIECERLQEVFRRNVVGYAGFKQLFDIAPTIIEAEESEEV